MENSIIGKKVILLVLIILLLVPFIVSTTAFSSENAIISADCVTAVPGDTVDVNISLSNNPGIVSATIKVYFDNSVLTLLNVSDAGVLGSPSHKPIYNSPYTLAWVNDMAAANYTVNGTIATLTFKVGSNAVIGRSYPITLSYNCNNYDIYNKDLNPVQFSINSGSVTINQGKASTSLSVSRYPNKTEYQIGDSLDTTGLQLELKNSDGSTSYITDGFSISGFSSDSAGKKTIVVSYQGKTTSFFVTVKDSSTGVIAVDSVLANPGDIVDVKINLVNNPGIISAIVNVSFDSRYLTLIKVTDSGLLGTETHKPELLSPYTLAWANDTANSNLTNTGTIATLSFKVSDSVEKRKLYPIELSYRYHDYDIYDKDTNPVRFNMISGGILVTDSEIILGDTDNDGDVEIRDAAWIQRYAANIDLPFSITKTTSDVDGNDEINVIDATAIQYYLANMNTSYKIGKPVYQK